MFRTMVALTGKDDHHIQNMILQVSNYDLPSEFRAKNIITIEEFSIEIMPFDPNVTKALAGIMHENADPEMRIKTFIYVTNKSLDTTLPTTD